jgi:excisionase family DNA binding protein
MSAYATAKHASLHQQGLHAVPKSTAQERSAPGILPKRSVSDGERLLDSLVGQLADRVAAAVVERLGATRVEQAPEWLDSREAAAYLGLHRDTLRKLAAERAIPAEQDGPGCKLFFRRNALDEWRAAGGRAGHPAALAA